MIGLFLTLVPVFMMSFANSRVFPDGRQMRRRMTVYLALFIVLQLVGVAVVGLAMYSIASGLRTLVAARPETLSRLMLGASLERFLDGLVPGQFAVARWVVSQARWLLAGLNTVVLILAIRYTNRQELSLFQQYRQRGLVGVRSSVGPSLVGVIFFLFLYFGMPVFLRNVLPFIMRLTS